MKVFCFFFSKKKPFLLTVRQPAAVILGLLPGGLLDAALLAVAVGARPFARRLLGLPARPLPRAILRADGRQLRPVVVRPLRQHPHPGRHLRPASPAGLPDHPRPELGRRLPVRLPAAIPAAARPARLAAILARGHLLEPDHAAALPCGGAARPPQVECRRNAAAAPRALHRHRRDVWPNRLPVRRRAGRRLAARRALSLARRHGARPDDVQAATRRAGAGGAPGRRPLALACRHGAVGRRPDGARGRGRWPGALPRLAGAPWCPTRPCFAPAAARYGI